MRRDQRPCPVAALRRRVGSVDLEVGVMTETSPDCWLDLYWLPLGADGSRVVRASGRLYEGYAARRAHRSSCDLYHSALKVHLDGVTHVIEVAPVWSRPEPARGVVAEGAVGRSAGGSRYPALAW